MAEKTETEFIPQEVQLRWLAEFLASLGADENEAIRRKTTLDWVIAEAKGILDEKPRQREGGRIMSELQVAGYACPLCGRTARTSAELLGQGCEGTHEPLVALYAVETLIETLQRSVCEFMDGAFDYALEEREIP